MTDDQLYQAYLAGDPTAGDRLMLRYGDALTAYLTGFLRSPHDAEDLMLDCFTVILVDKPRIGPGKVRAYLYRMARNMAGRLWKLRLRRQEFSLDEAQLTGGGSPEDAAWLSERSAVLQRCLGRIAPQYREALWLVYDAGLSYAQAAEVLGCGTKRIDNLLTNGKKQLRQELAKEGITDANL